MKSRNSNYSSYTGEQMSAMEQKIIAAQSDYDAKNSRYLASVALGSGHARWAKNNLLPGVNQAKSYLDDLKANYAEMRAATGEVQHIGLTDLTVNEATGMDQPKTDWSTIGLAVGALVVVVIIVKIL